MKSSGVTRVVPGTIRTCSMPRRSSTGQRQSANCVDNTSVPSDAVDANFFPAMATAKRPRNIAPHYDHHSSWCQYLPTRAPLFFLPPVSKRWFCAEQVLRLSLDRIAARVGIPDSFADALPADHEGVVFRALSQDLPAFRLFLYGS